MAPEGRRPDPSAGCQGELLFGTASGPSDGDTRTDYQLFRSGDVERWCGVW